MSRDKNGICWITCNMKEMMSVYLSGALEKCRHKPRLKIYISETSWEGRKIEKSVFSKAIIDWYLFMNRHQNYWYSFVNKVSSSNEMIAFYP